MKVANKKCIRRLAFKNMQSAKLRNLITITAVALTTILFTTLFTITLSIVENFQQSNFRQVGGIFHGIFKELTKEQFDELKEDPLIKEWGLRRVAGLSTDDIFRKSQVEVSYMDEKCAKFSFCTPIVGKLPEEGSNQAATDLKVLSLLGVEPEIGNEFTITINVDGTETTETFTLCGYWEYDEITIANHIIIAESRLDDILKKCNNQNKNGITGSYGLDVMFQNASSIEKDLNTVLENHGYQCEDTNKDNYIKIGINWGYVGAQLSDSMDFSVVLGIIAALALIIFTGYLIIYNIFQISVAGDIRHYGLLKTIGTTKKQIKKIVLIQSLFLSAVGIPIGLLLGYGAGVLLAPIVVRSATDNNSIFYSSASVDPAIFIGAAFFSIITVLISCRKPSKMAGKVSPIEALRYTESDHLSKKKKTKKVSKKGISILSMAYANMGRNRKKTFVTVISMSLSIVLFILTVTLSKGFSMEKYLSMKINTDYIVADAGYFNITMHWDDKTPVPDDIVKIIENMDGIADAGKTYGQTDFFVYDFISEEYMRSGHMSKYYPPDALNEHINNMPKEGEFLLNDIDIYGMDDFCLDKLKVWDGDISRLKTEENVIAAVYFTDDYGNMEEHTNWAKLGDTVKLRYAQNLEYYNTETGEIYENPDFNSLNELSSVAARPKEFKDVEYKVVAVVSISPSLNYRFYGSEQFVLNSEQFIKDTDTSVPMYYAFDMAEDESVKENMEDFIANYTENVDSSLNYESRYTYASEFESFRNMFLLMGSILSLIVGLIGILNFLNAILTGIITRHREFAMLQSIGMTGKQLKKMLVSEGLYYTLGSVIISFILAVISSPLVANVLENMFWFFEYHFIIRPLFIIIPIFALLGVLLPLISYHFFARKSIVERLRDAE
ncbi:MAG: ABC transporter permease [Lachnospiraceae bacterium]|nr:ABC transporter permease [Lachnospiraceae bacterium]